MQLLIHFRRIDFGEQLPFLHLVADIGNALDYVAIGAGEDGRLGDGLNIAGQHHFRVRGGDGNRCRRYLD